MTLLYRFHVLSGWRLEDGPFYLFLAGLVLSRTLDTAVQDKLAKRKGERH